MSEPSRPAPALDAMVETFRRLPTAAISDALDSRRLPGSAHGVSPLVDGARFVGRAFTLRYAAVGHPPGTVGDYIDEVPPGAVVVLDNGGRTDCTVWGDILTSVASARGIAGTAIWGVCRDVAKALEVGYPIFSAGRFMRTGKDRVAVVEVGGAVSLGDVRVDAGDIVVGDADGVVVVPRSIEGEIAKIAQQISDVEDSILAEALKPGGTLKAARAAHGYHALQHAKDGEPNDG